MNKLFTAMAVSLAVVLSGCASIYVDKATPEIPSSAFKKPASPKPVQVLVEFQTKGVANAAVTNLLAPKIIDQIKESGLFTDVRSTPAPDGSLLSVTLNNVPLTDDAFNKGFVTGLTFGLAGSQVSDGYVCTLKYTPTTQSTPITKTARHAIHTVLGAKEGPANGIKVDSFEIAAYTMTRQIVSTALDELSRDPGFK